MTQERDETMSFLRGIAMMALAAGVLAAGCSTTKVKYLTEERYSPTPAEEKISLYVNEVERPHVKIAYVQSTGAANKETETVREQLRDLREKAREAGADAVVNVQQLSDKIRGYVRDEKVPFRAYEQGTAQRYFLRGTAIRFVENPELADAPEETPLTPPADSMTPPDEAGIPEIVTRDPEEEYPIEVMPRGQAPAMP